MAYFERPDGLDPRPEIEQLMQKRIAGLKRDTQFGRAMHDLNVDIICANTPAAKGRVERANQTLQDRRVKELRLRGISDREHGNADLRFAIVGAPSYFATRPEPKSPRDLVNHTCINFRQPTAGGLYAWEFEKRGRELKVRVDGQLIFNRTPPMLNAARAGFGLACLMDDMVNADLEEGRLKRVLADWCPPFSGYHLYYPSRRQLSPAFVLLVNALRYNREPSKRASRPATRKSRS